MKAILGSYIPTCLQGFEWRWHNNTVVHRMFWIRFQQKWFCMRGFSPGTYFFQSNSPKTCTLGWTETPNCECVCEWCVCPVKDLFSGSMSTPHYKPNRNVFSVLKMGITSLVVITVNHLQDQKCHPWLEEIPNHQKLDFVLRSAKITRAINIYKKTVIKLKLSLKSELQLWQSKMAFFCLWPTSGVIPCWTVWVWYGIDLLLRAGLPIIDLREPEIVTQAPV